jgi:hypothetical protein
LRQQADNLTKEFLKRFIVTLDRNPLRFANQEIGLFKTSHVLWLYAQKSNNVHRAETELARSSFFKRQSVSVQLPAVQPNVAVPWIGGLKVNNPERTVIKL